MALITLNKLALPTGSVIQVVTQEVTGQVDTTSLSYTDITGLSVSITPSSTSSKIFVIANLCSARTARSNTSSINGFYNLVRGSTELTASRFNYYDNTNIDREIDGTITLTNLDSPNTTSATTYKCQFKCGLSSTTIMINQSSFNTPVSSITAMEIVG